MDKGRGGGGSDNVDISYNFKRHVASDIPIHGQFVAPENLKTQQYIITLNSWSIEHKMKLNKKKTTIMLVNFTEKNISLPLG